MATRVQFVLETMPDIVDQKVTEQALRQGYTRGAYPTFKFTDVFDEKADNAKQPDIITIDGRDDEPSGLARHNYAVDDDGIAPPTKVNTAAQDQAVDATNVGTSLLP